MSTLDLLTDTFPHGTPDGYRLGCRTIACPAALPCRDVHTRYCGDFAFAKLIDAGVPLPEILERDAASKEGIRQRDKIAAREERRAAAHPKVARPRSRAAAKASPQAATPTGQRRTPPAKPQRPHPGYKWLAQQLTAAAAALKTATIASRAGLSVSGAIENALNTATDQHRAATEALASIDQERPAAPTKPRAPRPRRAPRQLQPHGTNACRARGCDRPECIEAGREYHRLWMRRRRAEGIPLERHGTAYGYQLGCKDRETCPAEISCADASLAEERRRRREAGITEQAPRVPAEPVREHVRQLMACGMTVLGIAEKANVSKTGVKILLYGRSGARKGELPREIEQSKAQRILALQPTGTILAISA